MIPFALISVIGSPLTNKPTNIFTIKRVKLVMGGIYCLFTIAYCWQKIGSFSTGVKLNAKYLDTIHTSSGSHVAYTSLLCTPTNVKREKNSATPL